MDSIIHQLEALGVYRAKIKARDMLAATIQPSTSTTVEEAELNAEACCDVMDESTDEVD